jgi:hypothetical protein
MQYRIEPPPPLAFAELFHYYYYNVRFSPFVRCLTRSEAEEIVL